MFFLLKTEIYRALSDAGAGIDAAITGIITENPVLFCFHEPHDH